MLPTAKRNDNMNYINMEYLKEFNASPNMFRKQNGESTIYADT